MAECAALRIPALRALAVTHHVTSGAKSMEGLLRALAKARAEQAVEKSSVASQGPLPSSVAAGPETPALPPLPQTVGSEVPPEATARAKREREVSWTDPVAYTHLRAHETDADLVCRLRR